MQARSTGWRCARVLLLAALLAPLRPGASELAAQEGEETEPASPWRTSYFPYFSGLANDGRGAPGALRVFRPGERH
jgi:hypothetical protein